MFAFFKKWLKPTELTPVDIMINLICELIKENKDGGWHYAGAYFKHEALKIEFFVSDQGRDSRSYLTLKTPFQTFDYNALKSAGYNVKLWDAIQEVGTHNYSQLEKFLKHVDKIMGPVASVRNTVNS